MYKDCDLSVVGLGLEDTVTDLPADLKVGGKVLGTLEETPKLGCEANFVGAVAPGRAPLGSRILGSCKVTSKAYPAMAMAACPAKLPSSDRFAAVVPSMRRRGLSLVSSA